MFNLFKRKTSIPEIVQKGSRDFYGLSLWLTQNIRYTKDLSIQDDWKTSEQTIRNRKGDCEDFAVLAYDCLKYMGTVNIIKILCVYPVKGAGHAVCAFMDGQKWRYYTNGYLKDAESYGILIEQVAVNCRFKMNHFLETDMKGRVI